MKKENIALVIFLVFIVGAGVYFYSLETVPQNIADTNPVVVRTEQQKVVVDTNPPETTIPVVVSDPLLGIDYSSLEKDRLYTEEEGKYANLSEVGQKLLRAVLMNPKCIQNPKEEYCDEWEWIITHSSIVSLNGEYSLFESPTGKGGSYYRIFNLKQRKFAGKQLGYFGTQIRNNDVLIYVNNKKDKTQDLLYYKPGMSEFASIPLSEISSAESYWYYGDMGSEVLEGSIKNNILYINIFNEWKGEIGITVPKKLREATFDLNTLK